MDRRCLTTARIVVDMDLGLSGRTYIVTAGSQGLGHATAEALVLEGANVVLTSRHHDAAEQAASRLGSRAVGVGADNADPDTPQQLMTAARDHFGGLDGLLISVGGPPAGPAMGITDEQWQSAFDSVFLGAARLSREVAATLHPSASITFVLSGSVKSPIANLATSNGMRPGLAMLAKTMADELGPKGIRVNGLMPGRIETARIQELDAAAENPAQAKQRLVEAIPLGRYGDPAEFGKVAAFVMSPAASYLSGIMVPVDGGAARSL